MNCSITKSRLSFASLILLGLLAPSCGSKSIRSESRTKSAEAGASRTILYAGGSEVNKCTMDKSSMEAAQMKLYTCAFNALVAAATGGLAPSVDAQTIVSLMGVVLTNEGKQSALQRGNAMTVQEMETPT